MHNYHAKEQAKYQKTQETSGVQVVLIGATVLVMFIPIVLVVTASTKVYEKIITRFKNE